MRGRISPYNRYRPIRTRSPTPGPVGRHLSRSVSIREQPTIIRDLFFRNSPASHHSYSLERIRSHCSRSPRRVVTRQEEDLPLLRALSMHLSRLVSDERIQRAPEDFMGVTGLTNELLPEITLLTQAINALSIKVNALGEKKE